MQTVSLEELRERLGIQPDPEIPVDLEPWLEAVREAGRYRTYAFAKYLCGLPRTRGGAWRLAPSKQEGHALNAGLDPREGRGSLGYMLNRGLMRRSGNDYYPQVEDKPIAVEPEPEPVPALVFRAKYDSATGEWVEDWIEAVHSDPRFGIVREAVSA